MRTDKVCLVDVAISMRIPRNEEEGNANLNSKDAEIFIYIVVDYS